MIRVEVIPDPEAQEASVVIRGRADDPVVAQLQALLAPTTTTLSVTQRGTEHFLPLADILFIETEGRQLQVHTATAIYVSRRTLSALIQTLPGNFMQVAKSTVINLDQVAAVTRSLSSCAVAFRQSHKQVFASRRNVKPLLARLDARRG
ncbi:LytTR family DNA-binding domain-containing protein [Lacticaseibacillus absianus]|uniref:LytTR family DNA-binding domain-containing protein n=1 Tax=Lacticaseibacillus absianus TaxID=2729623 RepID=UPI0015CC27F6|nr:LytTR family DNA-binding domain-containing protein [Lacticaseibacillus absianus]